MPNARDFGVWIRQWADLSPSVSTVSVTPVDDEADLLFDVVVNGDYERGLEQWMVYSIGAYDSQGLTITLESAAPYKGTYSLYCTHDPSVGTTNKLVVQSNGGGIPLKTHVRPSERFRILFTSQDDSAGFFAGNTGVGVTEWGHDKQYLRLNAVVPSHAVAWTVNETAPGSFQVGADCYYVTPMLYLNAAVGAVRHFWIDEFHTFRTGAT